MSAGDPSPALGPNDAREAPAVTVAIVSYNTRELLRRCLRSLEADAESGWIEVWVVDNSSHDGSAEMVRADFPWVSLVASPDNPGFGAAVNEVARRTASEWIAPANADVAPRPGAIAALVQAMDADHRVAIAAPRLLRPDGTTQHTVHAFPVAMYVGRSLELHTVSRRLGDRLCLEGAWDERRPRRVDWADGAFLLVRREAFEAAGGFDPDQWLYAEDIDIAWRVARAGWSVRYEPSAVVCHEVSAATGGAFGAERFPRQVRAIYAWLARRRGVWVARACALAVVGIESLKFALLRPLWPLLGDRLRAVTGRARRRARIHCVGLLSRDQLLTTR